MLGAESDLMLHVLCTSSIHLSKYVCLFIYIDIVNPSPNIKQRLQHGDIVVTNKGTLICF